MSDCTPVRVNFTPKSVYALQVAAQVNEETRTDAINRAIQLYQVVSEELAVGTEIFFKRHNGKVSRMTLE